MTTDEIDSYLKKHLKNWEKIDNSIQRIYITDDWKVTLMITNTIGYLCENAWHHPNMKLTYDRVIITLTTHEEGNIITMRDLELAKKIEETLSWPNNNSLNKKK